MHKKSEQAAIVFLGQFNPAYFHPFWFKEHNLMPGVEVEEAEVLGVTHDVTIVQMDWLRIEAVRERLTLRTEDEDKFHPLRDLALGILAVSPPMMITQLGLNWDLAFDISDEATWSRISHKIAPREPWTNSLKNFNFSSLAIKGEREDELDGEITVVVRQGLSEQGKAAFLTFNDNVLLHENMPDFNVATHISGEFDRSRNKAQQVANAVFGESQGRP